MSDREAASSVAPAMGTGYEVAADSALAEALRECAAVCNETLTARLGDAEAGKPYFSALMLAAAGFERAAEARPEDSNHDVSLLIAATLAEEAAAAVRACGDDRAGEAAAACERAASLSRRARSS